MNPVENQRLGPRPTATPVPAGLSRARRAVLETLRGLEAPATLSTLADRTGLHQNTLRGHLDALARDRLVVRERAAPSGRGRPAWLWSATTADSPEYAGLAVSLASTLNRTSPDPAGAATEAGLEWGRGLVGSAEHRPGPARDGRSEVLHLLDVLGFAPEEDHQGRVRLTRCPLLDAARQQPEIVCRVHQGLVQGALERLGDVDTSPTLHPFSEPGGCALDLDRDPS